MQGGRRGVGLDGRRERPFGSGLIGSGGQMRGFGERGLRFLEVGMGRLEIWVADWIWAITQ